MSCSYIFIRGDPLSLRLNPLALWLTLDFLTLHLAHEQYGPCYAVVVVVVMGVLSRYDVGQ